MFYTHMFTNSAVLCGLPGAVITDNPATVTCPLCLNVMTYQMEAAL